MTVCDGRGDAPVEGRIWILGLMHASKARNPQNRVNPQISYVSNPKQNLQNLKKRPRGPLPNSLRVAAKVEIAQGRLPLRPCLLMYYHQGCLRVTIRGFPKIGNPSKVP